MRENYKQSLKEFKECHPAAILEVCLRFVNKQEKSPLNIASAFPFYDILSNVNKVFNTNHTSRIADNYSTIFSGEELLFCDSRNISFSNNTMSRLKFIQSIAYNTSLFYALQPTYSFILSKNDDPRNFISARQKNNKHPILTLNNWLGDRKIDKAYYINNASKNTDDNVLTLKDIIMLMDYTFVVFKDCYDRMLCEALGAQKVLDKYFDVNFTENFNNELSERFLSEFAGEPFYLLTLPVIVDSKYKYQRLKIKVFFFPFSQKLLVFSAINNGEFLVVDNYHNHLDQAIKLLVNEYFKTANKYIDEYVKQYPKFSADKFYFSDKRCDIILMDPMVVIVGNILNNYIVRAIDEDNKILSLYYKNIYSIRNAGLTLIKNPSNINSIHRRYIEKECQKPKTDISKIIRNLRLGYNCKLQNLYSDTKNYEKLAYSILNYYFEKLEQINDIAFKDNDFLFKIIPHDCNNCVITLRDNSANYIELVLAVPIHYYDSIPNKYYLDDNRKLMHYRGMYTDDIIAAKFFRSFVIRLERDGNHYSKFEFIGKRNPTIEDFARYKKKLYNYFCESTTLFLFDRNLDVYSNDHRIKDSIISENRIDDVFEIMSKYFWYFYEAFNSSEFIDGIIGNAFQDYIDIANSNQTLIDINNDIESKLKELQHVNNVIGGTQLNNYCNNININNYENLDDFILEVKYYLGSDSIINLKKVNW